MLTKELMRDLKRQHEEKIAEMRGERNRAISKLLTARFYLGEIAENDLEGNSAALAKLGLCDDSEGFIGGIRHELRTQDNRATGDPLFIVQQERTVWGLEEEYSDDCRWVFIDSVVRDQFEEDHGYEASSTTELDPEDFGWEKVFIKKHWEFVTAHLTERAAGQYLEQNRHNLTSPRVYVTSQYRCHEWNRLRKALIA